MRELELLVAAQKAREESINPEATIALGTGLGAAAGIVAGTPLNYIGNQINSGKAALAARQGIEPAPKGITQYVKPGHRMAGGLVGMILGGVLGNKVRDEALNSAPEIALISKYVTGTQTEDDAYQLSLLLKDRYRDMGIA